MCSRLLPFTLALPPFTLTLPPFPLALPPFMLALPPFALTHLVFGSHVPSSEEKLQRFKDTILRDL
eukprot:3143324-Rhodomonas_salina.2